MGFILALMIVSSYLGNHYPDHVSPVAETPVYQN